MTNLNKASLALAVASALTLTGCGGGSSSSSGAPDPGTGGGETEVKAIDGYLAKADVYVDANQNGKLDAAERDPKVGTTDEDGVVKIAKDHFSGQLLVEAVAGQTIDSDSGAVNETFVLTAPQGSKYVTPFTHLMQVTGSSPADLARDLGLNESLITGDFIEAQNDTNAQAVKSAQVAHALARFIVTETKKQTTPGNISSNLIEAKNKVETRIENGEDASLVEVELSEDGNTIVESAPSRLAFDEAELANTTWTMFRFDDTGDNEQMYLQLGTINDPAGLCISNEAFSFLYGDPTISAPDKGTCSDGTYEVTEAGTLKMSFLEDNEVAEFTVLYRNTEAHEGGEIRTFVMVSDTGELFWLDNNSFLEDAGDYIIKENNIRYLFMDDASARDRINYMRGERRFTVTGDEPYTVSGQSRNLNKGTINFGEIGSAEWETTFSSMPAYSYLEQFSPSDDDILVVREDAADENDLHYHFNYRTSGELELMLDHKPSNGSENLYLQSSNKALIEQIADEVEARNSGTQGDS